MAETFVLVHGMAWRLLLGGGDQNLGRTLFKVEWRAGGESVLLVDDLAGFQPTDPADTGSLSGL